MKYIILAMSLFLAGCEKIPVEAKIVVGTPEIKPGPVTLEKRFVTEVCYDGFTYIILQQYNGVVGFSPKIISEPALGAVGTNPTFEKCE